MPNNSHLSEIRTNADAYIIYVYIFLREAHQMNREPFFSPSVLYPSYFTAKKSTPFSFLVNPGIEIGVLFIVLTTWRQRRKTLK